MTARSRLWALLSSFLLLSVGVSSLRLGSRFASKQPPSLYDQITADLAPYKARGISDSMVNGVYCGIRDPGFRVQIKNQEVYIVGEVEGFQSRNRNIKLALVDVASEFKDLPDCDFVVGTYDWTATEVQPSYGYESGGPVLAQAKKAEHTNAILYPDHTFTDWQEADTTSWNREQYMMRRAAMHHPWMARDASLLFRGSNLTGNRHIATGYATTPEVDIRVWDWVQEPAHEHFIGLPQHCRSKYLLNWPGNSYSARLKYLLLCGSVVVHSDNDWYEFYYPMLQHGENFMKIRALNSTDDLHNGLTQLVQRLNSNPKRSRHIAASGQHFAQETLSASNVKEYWYRLLKEYAALQKHTIRLHPDAVPLGVSLSHPRYIHYRNRTGCHMLNDMGDEDGLPQGPYQPAGYHSTAAVSATAEPEAVIAPVINEPVIVPNESAAVINEPPVVPNESASVTEPAVVRDAVTDRHMTDLVPEPDLLEPLDRALESDSRVPAETGAESVGELMAEPLSNPLPDESAASVLLPELDT